VHRRALVQLLELEERRVERRKRITHGRQATPPTPPRHR
jgi:hypothetical protein